MGLTHGYHHCGNPELSDKKRMGCRCAELIKDYGETSQDFRERREGETPDHGVTASGDSLGSAGLCASQFDDSRTLRFRKRNY